MDWDWEDRPPSDAPPPRRAPDEPDGEPDLRRPEPESPEPLDESVTQVFSAEAAWEQGREQAPDEPAKPPPSPEYVLPDRTETGRPAPSAEFERPRTRTIEAAERAAVAGARGPDDDYERRPSSTHDRAARRQQRRRQLRRRRLVALAILLAIIALIVVLLVRGCGGSDAGAAVAAFGMIVVDRRFLVAPERQ